jgi:Cof subfamily protein (haloacid dehalogenase superfamily)
MTGEPSARPSADAPLSVGPIRLVAIDLDGTLLNDAKQVSEQTADALCCLPQRDVRVVIASARPPRSVRHVYRALRLDTWQINYNGALIWDEPGRATVFHRPLPGAVVRDMVELARDMYDEVIVTCEVLDRWYTDRFDDAHTTETGRLFKPDYVGPLDDVLAGEVTKLLLLGEPRIILRLEDLLNERFGEHVSIVKTDEDMLQVMDRRVSKARALERVAAHYGVPLTQVLAIGDAPNDVGMLGIAGVAVAMDNAHPLVKEIADWVAPSNNDHGVHAALARYGLC